ncbi:Antiseptic resistance protein [Corynebacterium capitovis DSM 44611]|uniref:MFS transporter n=1 Tax=Corynebacterium capitovis TaxID=131081 RepID=UPI000378D451|nr:MFS transporter [Corynebacterium capitovis]WKD56629.1 Antiseptic resistance protein [Corynebacterium capitovis DSM 44611]
MTASQRWGFFAVVSLGLLMVGLDNSILYTALPVLTEQLRATSTQSLWIINAYPLVLAGLLLGTGTLGDKVGHRLMFVVGLTVFGLASLTAAFAPGVGALIAARAFLGVGAAAMMPATLALIRLTFDDERERNTAIGIWGSVAVVGAGLGPVLGGLLLEMFWWGSIFLINVPIVVIALALTFVLAPENLPNPEKQWDAVSSLWALLALTGLTMTIKEAVNPDRTLLLLAGGVVAGVVGAVLFARRQPRLAQPLLTLDVFRSRIFSGGIIAAAGAMFVTAGVELMTTQKLQLVDGLSPLHAGLIVVVMAVAAFPASTIGGANLHRWGFLPLIAGGFAGAAAGATLLSWATEHNSLSTALVALAVLGWSTGSVMSVSSTAIIGSAPRYRSGMAAGVEEVSYELGTLLTVAVTGSLLPMMAYQSVVGLLAVAALVFCVLSLWLFQGNPKSGEYA